MYNLANGQYVTTNLKHLEYFKFLFRLQCFRVPLTRYLIENFMDTNIYQPVQHINKYEGEPVEWTLGALIYYINKNI